MRPSALTLEMKILFLALDVDLGGHKGDSIHVGELASSLANLGNEVFLIVAKCPKASIFPETQNIHYYENIKRGNISTLLYCLQVGKDQNAEVIYERRFSPKMGATLSRLLGIPLIVEINGLVEEEARMTRTLKEEPLLVSSTKKKMRKRFFEKAKRIVAVSEGIKRGLHEQYNIPLEKIDVVPNGANIEILKPMDQTACQKRLRLDIENKYICFVGNLVPWQGVETIIDSAPIVLQSFSTVKFLIVGDGISRSALESKVKALGLSNAFVFAGSIPYTEVSQYINSSEICLAPFTKERNEITGLSPLKIFEYLACEKPIVASDVRGIKDIIVPCNCGIAVKPDNPSELAGGIIKLLSDDKLREEMGRRGKKLIEEKYTWESVASRIANIFISVCKDPELEHDEKHH